MKELAYCGIYCTECSFRVANETDKKEHLQNLPDKYSHLKDEDLAKFKCDGCKADPSGDCGIKECAVERQLDSCADCGDFPCAQINEFETEGVPHHSQAIQNLRDIKAQGFEEWRKNHQAKLACGHCGERLSWYYTCPSHGSVN